MQNSRVFGEQFVCYTNITRWGIMVQENTALKSQLSISVHFPKVHRYKLNTVLYKYNETDG